MKITKAIEILDLNIREGGKSMPPDVCHALSLGKEALKRIQSWRHLYPDLPQALLPGEEPD